MYSTLPLISNEVICARYDGVLMRGEFNHTMAMWQNDSSNISELMSQNNNGCYDNNEFGQVPLLPL